MTARPRGRIAAAAFGSFCTVTRGWWNVAKRKQIRAVWRMATTRVFAARGHGRHAGQELTGSGNNLSREEDRRSSMAKFRKDHVFIRSSLVCRRRGLT